MRQSLLPPIEELELAAKLLDAAADAILQNRISLAGKLIDNANFSEISTYAIKLVGPMSLEVHRSIKRPKTIPKYKRDPIRMPSGKEQNSIFARDGWRCRFCNTKVINKEARKVLLNILMK